MTKKIKNNITSEKIKDYWCSYSLQQLAPKKFAEVVRNILKGKYKLLTDHKPSGDSRKTNREL
jgi:hypothetical protein